MSSYRKTMKEALEEVSLYGQKLKEAMPPTKHVSSEGDKFVVKDMNGKVVQKFMDKGEADEYATKNHDKLMLHKESEEEIEEEEEVDEGIVGNLAKAAGTAVVKKVVKKVSDKVSDATGVTAVKKGINKVGKVVRKVKGTANKIKKAAQTEEEVDLDEANPAKMSDDVLKSRLAQMEKSLKTRGDDVATQFEIKRLKKEMKKRGIQEEVDLDDKNKLNEEELGEQIVNKNYLETKSGSIEQSVMEIWKNATVVTEKKLDAVGKEDGDIDNDGDKDSSDKYLAKRRKAISKSMKKEEEDELDEGKMSVLHQMIKDKKSAEEISKAMKVDVNTIKTLMANYSDMAASKMMASYESYDFLDDIDEETLSQIEGLLERNDTEELNELLGAIGRGIKKVATYGTTANRADRADKKVKKIEKKNADKERLMKAKDRLAQLRRPAPSNESYEMGTDEYRKHTQSITPGQEVTDYQNFKVESMKEALAKVWGLDEWKNTKENRRVDGGDKRRLENKVKSGKTITGKTSDVIDLKPTTEEKQLDEILPALAAPVAAYAAKKAIGAVAKKVMGPKEEEKMVTANYMIKSGKSAEDVAKVINVDVKEIKKVMSAYHDEQNSHYKEYLAAACGGGSSMGGGLEI